MLDRPALRLLRRELRRAEAIALASRALRRRDLTKQGLRERLERGSVAPATAEESLEVLARAGLVDDDRFARSRAEALAGRGYGNAAIRADLAGQGVTPEACEAALAELGPEAERAARIVQRRGRGARTARYLAARGFRDETVETALGPDFANHP
jgi:regulatory protein